MVDGSTQLEGEGHDGKGTFEVDWGRTKSGKGSIYGMVDEIEWNGKVCSWKMKSLKIKICLECKSYNL